MSDALSPRMERVCAIVAAGLWVAGLAALWAMVRPSPRSLAATLVGSYFLAWGTALVLERPPRRRRVARFALTTLALGTALGTLELGSAVGLVDYRRWFVVPGFEAWANPDNVPDPELVHVHRPHLTRAGATRGDLASALHLRGSPLYPYEVRYDGGGFRNPRDLSAADVAVVGDSFVEGALVPAGETFPAALGRLLGREVVNLGQANYGPQQELIVLKRSAMPLHPGLCIWVFYEGNDLDDAARYEAIAAGRPAPGAARSTPWDRSFGRSALRLLARKIGPFLEPEDPARLPWGTFAAADGRETRVYFSDRGASTTAREQATIDRVAAVLAEAATACRAGGTPLLVAFAPQKFRVYRDLCSFRPDNPCARWGVDDLPERLRARVEAIGAGVGFLDLTPALSAEAARGRLLYFADDTHWSAEGHRVVARAVADHVAGRRGEEAPRWARGGGKAPAARE